MQQNALATVAVRVPGHELRQILSYGSDVSTLVNHARAALNTDLEVARACLDQISAVLVDGHAGPPHLRPGVSPGKSPSALKGGLTPWQIRRISDYIDEHLADPISLGTLSSIGRLSCGHFCRAFKISMGLTPHAYVQRRRIELAKSMMLDTDESLSQIACACGLADQSHLTRLFRQHVGQTPLAWRRTWKMDA
jgi:AraC-like DNA-binding protein